MTADVAALTRLVTQQQQQLTALTALATQQQQQLAVMATSLGRMEQRVVAQVAQALDTKLGQLRQVRGRWGALLVGCGSTLVGSELVTHRRGLV